MIDLAGDYKVRLHKILEQNGDLGILQGGVRLCGDGSGSLGDRQSGDPHVSGSLAGHVAVRLNSRSEIVFGCVTKLNLDYVVRLDTVALIAASEADRFSRRIRRASTKTQAEQECG